MLTRPDSSPPESAVGTTPALPPGGGRRMSGWVFSFFSRPECRFRGGFGRLFFMPMIRHAA
ncbi:hypothetical protein DF19_02290 [Streptomyces olindensis]|nr:hypothetical protein DF19_02290 [Streptomyces olindensis]